MNLFTRWNIFVLLFALVIGIQQAAQAVNQLVNCTTAWDCRYKNPLLLIKGDSITFNATCLQTASGCPGFHDVIFAFFRREDPPTKPFIQFVVGGWDNTRSAVNRQGSNWTEVSASDSPTRSGPVYLNGNQTRPPLNAAVSFTITLNKQEKSITVTSPQGGYSYKYVGDDSLEQLNYIGFSTWRAKMQYEITGGVDTERPINYYQMLEIRSEAYHQRPFWSWSGAGDAGKGPNPAGGPNSANHLLLIGENMGDDNRAYDGAGLFWLRKLGSPDFKRGVQFGDSVEIIAPIDAYGYGQCFVRPCVLYAYNKNGVDNGGLLLSTDADNQNATNGNQVFIIKSPTGAKGQVTETTPFVLYSAALKQEVFASNSSPWPNHHQIALTADKADAQAKLFSLHLAHRTWQNGPQWDQATALNIFNSSPIIPKGFDHEGGWSTQVTAGSKDGKLEAWCIGANYKRIYRWDENSTDGNGWTTSFEPQDEQGSPLGELEDISASSDGVLLVLTKAGKVYEYNWDGKSFKALTVAANQQDLDLDVIAAGGEGRIWAVDIETGKLYNHHEKDGWILRLGGDDGVHVVNVAADVEGNIVWVDADGHAHILDREATDAANKGKGKGKAHLMWKELGDADDGPIENIAIGDRQTILATRKGSGTLLVWQDNDWVVATDANGKPTRGIDCISTNAKGAAQFITDQNGNMFNRGHGGVAVTAKPAKDDAKKDVVTGKNKVVAKKVKAEPSQRAQAKKAGEIEKPVKHTKASNKATGNVKRKAKRENKAANARAKVKNAGGKKGGKKGIVSKKHISKRPKKAHKPAPKPGAIIEVAPVTTTAPAGHAVA